MTLLVLGVVLWAAAHLFKRAAPGARAGLTDALGQGPAKGIVALVLLVSLVVMVIGYRAAPYVAVYTPPAWGIHVNNLAMLFAVGLVGAGHSRSRVRGWLRHPMLVGVIVWALAHLLVNGDVASLLLFGGLGIWAIVEMALINAQEPVWTRPAPGSAAGDVPLVLITLVLFGVIAAIHTWLGYWPFPQ